MINRIKGGVGLIQQKLSCLFKFFETTQEKPFITTNGTLKYDILRMLCKIFTYKYYKIWQSQ